MRIITKIVMITAIILILIIMIIIYNIIILLIFSLYDSLTKFLVVELPSLSLMSIFVLDFLLNYLLHH